jgi:hypothetical protein
MDKPDVRENAKDQQGRQRVRHAIEDREIRRVYYELVRRKKQKEKP